MENTPEIENAQEDWLCLGGIWWSWTKRVAGEFIGLWMGKPWEGRVATEQVLGRAHQPPDQLQNSFYQAEEEAFQEENYVNRDTFPHV